MGTLSIRQPKYRLRTRVCLDPRANLLIARPDLYGIQFLIINQTWGIDGRPEYLCAALRPGSYLFTSTEVFVEDHLLPVLLPKHANENCKWWERVLSSLLKVFGDQS